MLLLGHRHDADTTVHLAESLAGVRYRLSKCNRVRRRRHRARRHGEIDHCCENFNKLDEWLDADHRQRRDIIGRGDARLIRSRDVVDVAVRHLRENETVFLHPVGVDAECDAARASL